MIYKMTKTLKCINHTTYKLNLDLDSYKINNSKGP